MATKAELVQEAEELGIEVSDEASAPEIRNAIKEVKEGKSLSYARIQEQAELLFGVPRSVVVGARSAGFLPDPATKVEAEKAIQKFLEYEGGKD